MKKKNAEITIEEVVKIVLAVIGIIILIIIAAGLYGIFTKKADLEQAKESLDQLMAKVKVLEEGDSGNYLITSPNDWYVISYKEGEPSPRDCAMENCLCICKGFNINDCDVRGVCQKNPDEIKIVELSDKLSYAAVNYFRIKKVAINLIFKKQEGIIKFDIGSSLNDKGFFNQFLDSKSEFLDKGEITIAEQIKYYINSGSAPAYRDGDARRAVTKDIQDYFAEYNYPIDIFILSGKGYSELNINIANELKVSAGKDRAMGKDENIPDWPYLIIENPESKIDSLKNLVVITQIRK